ncbi:MAG: aminoacetone oxidase family FAD-binding enzyme [Oscillospiraceae bacterium]|nr:aminoacetone oxidase family FAD-binding enzyme [Oscillospiraceae bacterium]
MPSWKPGTPQAGDKLGMPTRLLVIGGGPAGLAAAIAAARSEARVTIADRMDRVGKKLLATGNGRCNLSNAKIEECRYHGAGAATAYAIVERFGGGFASDFFRGLGVLTVEDDQSRLYPATFHAPTVLNALRAEASHLGVAELCGHEAVSITKKGDVFTTEFRGKPAIITDKVVVAAGGMASPHFGSDGSGYGLMTALGHGISTPPAPALTQLCLDPRGIRGLKGVRVRSRLTLYKTSGMAARRGANDAAMASRHCEDGDILFTEYGVSGIPALNLSCRIAPDVSAQRNVGGANGGVVGRTKNAVGGVAGGKAGSRVIGGAGSRVVGRTGNRVVSGAGGAVIPCAGYMVSIDLLPDFPYEELYGFIRDQAERRPESRFVDILGGVLHKRAAELIVKQIMGGNGEQPCGAGAAEERDAASKRLAATIKDWKHTLTGVMGFSSAQVTYGGLSFDDFDTETLESKIVKGLYAAGEILDTAGECGGYNLHWAWVSGCLAGACAAADAS